MPRFSYLFLRVAVSAARSKTRSSFLSAASCCLALLLLAVVQARGDGEVTDCTEASLRSAIAEGGVITFDTVDCQIELSDPIVITNDIVLDGSGQDITISGSGGVRLFLVLAGGSLELNGITLSAGDSTNGAAIYVSANATLIATDCVFTNNHAIGATGADGADGKGNAGTGTDGGRGLPGGSAFGGAIYNLGDVELNRCLFVTNSAAGGDGGNGGNGGNGGFAGGNGGNGGNGGTGLGGAIYHAGTSLAIADCTFSNNFVLGGNGGLGGTNGSGPFPGRPGQGGAGAAASGAAVYALQDAGILNCTFVSNHGTGGDSAAGGTQDGGFGGNGPRGGDSLGGGIYNNAVLEATNCTFFGNRVTGGHGGDGGPGEFTGGNGGNGGDGSGGGLYNLNDATVASCTFSSSGAVGGTNGAAGGGSPNGSSGNPGRGRGGNLANGGGTLTLVNTIISTNSAGTNISKIGGTILDGGYNISSDNSFNFSGTSRKNIDPKLNGLADNGGSTFTMALKTGSPAIDAANDTAAPDTDQRGVIRPLGAHSDIGAFELGSVIEGRVTTGTNGVAGVLITAGNQTATTDASGNYSVNAFGSAVVVAPSKAGFVFTPASRTVDARSDRTGVDFEAVELFRISGQVFGVSAPVTVTLNSTNTTADASGRYSFTNLDAGTYLVTPVAEGFQFDPPSATVTVGPSNTNLNFFALFQISGRVMNGANGFPGVTVEAGGGVSAVTDSNGFYTISQVRAGDYFLSAVLSGFSFNPAQQEVTVGPSASNVNFSAAAPQFTVTGRVTYGANGLAGVRIFGAQQTDANGNFSLSLPADTYTFRPVKSGYLFSPASRTITVTANVAGVDFAAGAGFSSIRVTNGGVLLSLVGPPGATRVQASTNLIDWVTIYTNNPAFQFLDADATNYPQRFYRSVQP